MWTHMFQQEIYCIFGDLGRNCVYGEVCVCVYDMSHLCL